MLRIVNSTSYKTQSNWQPFTTAEHVDEELSTSDDAQKTTGLEEWEMKSLMLEIHGFLNTYHGWRQKKDAEC